MVTAVEPEFCTGRCPSMSCDGKLGSQRVGQVAELPRRFSMLDPTTTRGSWIRSLSTGSLIEGLGCSTVATKELTLLPLLCVALAVERELCATLDDCSVIKGVAMQLCSLAICRWDCCCSATTELGAGLEAGTPA